jgi:hypothetical protein
MAVTLFTLLRAVCGRLIMHCNGGVVCALVEHDHSGAAIRLRLAGRAIHELDE